MIILDTQAWIWWTHDLSRLSQQVITAIESAEKSDGIRISVISVWEIALKSNLGKLKLPLQINEWVHHASSYPNLTIELLSIQDAIASTQLPGEFHKDPADRIIVALARRHKATLITSDKLIRAYPYVKTL